MQITTYFFGILMVLMGLQFTACERAEVLRDETDLIDERDGQRYSTEEYGNQVWMAENLAYNLADSKVNPDNPFSEYGRLYNYEQALTVCPKGWRLPTDVDWQELERYLGMEAHTLGFTGHRGRTIGDALKSNSGWLLNNGSNSRLFNAYPSGRYDAQGEAFEFLGQRADFWSSTEDSAAKGWTRSLTKDFDTVLRSSTSKNNYLSCRCVKNE
jgi:uncharacterized protein (TIGR02145 family)